MHEPEAIEGLGPYLLEHKPIVLIEILSEEIAEKLNALIDTKEHVIFYLNENNAVEVERFSIGQIHAWNYIFFHKDLIEKIKLHTSLYKKR
jgi:hypothetical protein